jgi:hypothetical protein
LVPNSQICLIIGIQLLASALVAIDIHIRTNRLIAKIDRMCNSVDGKVVSSDGSYKDDRRRWEEQRLIFEERVRQTYLPRDSK